MILTALTLVFLIYFQATAKHYLVEPKDKNNKSDNKCPEGAQLNKSLSVDDYGGGGWTAKGGGGGSSVDLGGLVNSFVGALGAGIEVGLPRVVGVDHQWTWEVW